MQALKDIYNFLLEVYTKFNQHRGALLAAGIAFFIFFSIFPLLLFSSITLTFFLEDPAVRDQILDYVFANIPALADFVRETIDALVENRSSASIIALLGFLWAGTNLFGGIAVGINAVYEVAETRNLLVQKLIAIGVYFIIAALIGLSFGATAVASVFRDEVLSVLFPDRVVSVGWTVFNLLVSIILTVLLFLVVYRLVPNVKLSFGSILPGTITAGLLWQVAEYGFAFYLNAFARQGYGAVYGSLATIVLFLFWLYISSVLLLLGAEINVAYRRRKTGGVKHFEPRKGGEPHIRSV